MVRQAEMLTWCGKEPPENPGGLPDDSTIMPAGMPQSLAWLYALNR